MPFDRIVGGRMVGDLMCLAINRLPGHPNRTDDALVLAEPDAEGRLQEARWYGPWRLPRHGWIHEISSPKGRRLFLTTTEGVYWVDVNRLTEAAKQAKQVYTTGQWQRAYAARLDAADWRVRIKAMLARGQVQDAMKLLDQRRANLVAKESAEGVDLLLWRAFTLAARPETREEALAVFREVAANRQAEPTAMFGARTRVIELLWDLEQYDRVLEEGKEFKRLFPTKRDRERARDAWRYIEQAREKMAAPTTQPAAAPDH